MQQFKSMAKRILLVNKFFYSRGGAEVVTINLKNELSSRGYEVGVFTMDYRHLMKVDNLFTTSEVSFKDGWSKKIRFARRTLGDLGVEETFKDALDTFKPDVVHLHNIHSYISPVVAEIAKARGCRVVWTLHDYKLACPAYSCLNHGKICEKCFIDKRHILHECCFKESFTACVLAYFEAKKWNRERLERSVDAFICPSNFMREEMLKAGFSPEKLHVICNFIDPIKAEELSSLNYNEKEDYYTFIGRFSLEKGLETLLKVATKLPYRLKIAGNGPLREYFMTHYSAPQIEYLGSLDATEVSKLLAHSKLQIVPSECYENNPLSVIESLYAGTPVIGTNIGGIPELINEKNGKIIEMGDDKKLEEFITTIMNSSNYNYSEIANSAHDRFSSDRHFEKLMKLYFDRL
jgi:glycosyltransferase involved in cell wall biosynthesis